MSESLSPQQRAAARRSRVPAPSLVLALSLHVWFGAVGVGWWYMEWLIARADDDLSTDNMVLILILGAVLWLGAGYAIVRTNRARPRMTWLLLIGWIVAFALLFALR